MSARWKTFLSVTGYLYNRFVPRSFCGVCMGSEISSGILGVGRFLESVLTEQGQIQRRAENRAGLNGKARPYNTPIRRISLRRATR
jgi:hypothetical protein